MPVRTVGTRMILEGEKEYREAAKGIGAQLKTLESELKLVDSQYKGQQNTMAALEARHKALSDVLAKQAERLRNEQSAMSAAKELQSQYAEQAAAARQKLEQLSQSTDEATKGTDAYKAQVKALQSEIARNEEAEKRCASAVEQHTQRANGAQVKINELNRALQQNDAYLDEARQSADGCARSIDALGKEAQQVGEEAQTAGNQGQGAVEALAGALAAAGIKEGIGAIAEAIKECVDASVQYESAMAGVAKTCDMSGEALEGLKQRFREMSTEMPVSAAELANIAESAGQLGIAQSQLESFTRVMAQLGTATNMSSSDAATTLAQLAGITGMDASLYGNLGSALVALGNAFATNERKIAEMSQGFAGAANNAGIGEQAILGFSAAVTSLGIESGLGGTSMSKLVGEMQLAVETGEGLEEWAKAAGMSASDFAVLWGQDATAAVLAFVQGLSTAEGGVLQTLQTLGITESQMKRVIMSLSNAESKNKSLSRALTVSNTAWKENAALAKEASTRYETTESKVQMYQNSLENLKSTVGDQLSPALSKLAKGGTEMNAKLAEFIASNREVVPIMSAVVAGVGTFTTVVAGAAGVLIVVKKAMDLLNGTMMASPWFWAVAGVTALVAALGALCLTTRNEVAELTEASSGLKEAMAAADEGYKSSVAEVEGEAAKAEALIGRIRELEASANAGTLSSNEWLEWQALLSALTETVPELKGMIDLQTYAIQGGTAALQANTSAWRENALEQAKQKVMQEKYDAYGDAVAETVENQIKLVEAQGKADTAYQTWYASLDRIADALGITRDEVRKLTLAELQQHPAMKKNGEAILGMYEECAQLSKEAAAATEQVTLYTEAVALGHERTEAATQAIDNYGAMFDSVTGKTEGASDSVEHLSAAQQKQVSDFEALRAELTELTATYQEQYDHALENINNTLDGFHKMEVVKARSVKDSEDAVDSQILYLSEYSNNLIALKKMADDKQIDLSDMLVVKLSDGSTESAAILKGLVEDGGEHLAELNEKYKLLDEGKETFATIVSEMVTSFSEKSAEITNRMEKMAGDFDQSAAAGKNGARTAAALNTALREGISTTQSLVNRYNSILGKLGRRSDGSAVPIGSHAQGLTYVPSDDYPANLHRGEMVLTRLQADAYRAQLYANTHIPEVETVRAPSSAPQQPAVIEIDYDRLGEATARAMSGMRVTLDKDTVVGEIAPEMSERLGAMVQTGRFDR